jgi:PPK2 family polyphosphate:nucleotide phosphotransferase
MDRYRIKRDQKISLKNWDARDDKAYKGGKAQGLERLQELNLELEKLQEMLYAEHKHRVLIVLQGMDSSGKDGTIRHVFEGVNPQGVRVASFKVPTDEEMDHDYLWRIHKQTPRKGEIVIFNRSHYEDVLVVRVHELVAREVWRRRYAQINCFEHMLAEEGTTILKFFLLIDMDEQKERFQSRLDDPKKHWKFNPGDLDERKLWDQYVDAYQDVLNKTSTNAAPWYIIPSNRKWYRNLMIANILVKTLKNLKMSYPEAEHKLDGIEIE